MSETKKTKVTYESVKAELNLSADELKVFNDLVALNLTPAKVRNAINASRKQAKKIAEKLAKAENAKADIAKKAIEKIANAKALYSELKNLQAFAGYEKELLVIKNVSNYANFKGRVWKVYGTFKIQDETYIVTLEYDKQGNFALPCFINVEDIILEDSQVKILDYEKDSCLSMVYEKVNQ